MREFTASQQRAIALRGDVLVLAGAGTGKTRTLVARCIQWLQEAPGQNSLEHILMVTFTEAAAAEMRHRIRAELKVQQAKAPRNTHLAEQLSLLDSALISTLHSFCYRLVRQHFYELELDPQLTILPAEEAELLAQETLSKLLQRHLASNSAPAKAVQQLIQRQARGWDLPIKRLILQLHRHAQALPDPEGWCSNQLQAFSMAEPKLWPQWLAQACANLTREWSPLLKASAKAVPNVASCAAALEQITPTARPDQVCAALCQIEEARKAKWPYRTVGQVKDKLAPFFAEAAFLQGLTGRSALPPELMATSEEADDPELASLRPTTDDPLLQDWTWIRSEMQTLLELTLEFGRDFALAKHELGVADFADLEQFTLRLLWDKKKGQPSSLATSWQRQLRLIFVDEYQDINAAQDAILCALAGQGDAGNRFLVGDPKQSIYRFRLADPAIFQTYAQEWGKGEANRAVVTLAENFRSSSAILEFVNECFAALMQREIGGIEYDAQARLHCGTERPQPDSKSNLPKTEAAVELHLRITTPKSSSEPDGESNSADELSLSKTESEARLVGLRLAQLRAQQFPIRDRDSGEERPATWRDMVVLLRSPQHKVEAFAKEFARLKIPLVATRGGFFDSPAVCDLLSLLAVLDNPLQDIPLLTVLRSPIVGLSVDELALIRLAAKGRFWNALRQFQRAFPAHGKSNAAESLDSEAAVSEVDQEQKLHAALTHPKLQATAQSTWGKVQRFLSHFKAWRQLTKRASVADCLDEILVQTDYSSLVWAQERGEQHQANISKLHNWARQFDQFQGQGLFRFLQFVEAQKEAAIDREPAPVATTDAVRLMSIHQSKGLEFGIVVVADLGKSFNLRDLHGDVIIDRAHGLCSMVKPPFTEQRYPSLPYWLAQRTRRKDLLGEELRLLYVAFTRACQKLILTGSTSASAVERWQKQATARPSTQELLGAKSYLDWLGPWLPEATGSQEWASLAEGCGQLLRWRVYQENDNQRDEPLPSQSIPFPTVEPDPNLVRTVLERVIWTYPFDAATRQIGKASVSHLRAGLTVSKEGQDRPIPNRARWSSPNPSKLSAAEVGAANHLLLQYASPDSMRQIEALKSESERLVVNGLISAPECAAINLAAIVAFWNSEIGKSLLDHQRWWHREMPFTARLNLTELHQLEQEFGSLGSTEATTDPARVQATVDDDFLVLTGVVDLAVLLPDEIWLLDFKTDATDSKHVQESISRYRPQIRLYVLALSRIYVRPVKHAWLHFLDLSQSFHCL